MAINCDNWTKIIKQNQTFVWTLHNDIAKPGLTWHYTLGHHTIVMEKTMNSLSNGNAKDDIDWPVTSDVECVLRYTSVSMSVSDGKFLG